jgi:hypothetical protein
VNTKKNRIGAAKTSVEGDWQRAHGAVAVPVAAALVVVAALRRWAVTLLLVVPLPWPVSRSFGRGERGLQTIDTANGHGHLASWRSAILRRPSVPTAYAALSCHLWDPPLTQLTLFVYSHCSLVRTCVDQLL